MGKAIDQLMALRDDPYSFAKAWKERTGKPVIGFFCCYAPEELIHAAGALPVRITGRNAPVSSSGAHLQNYCCSLARTSLDMALEGDLDFMDGTVFVHTCDTMMRLSDIWRLNAGFAVHIDTVLPVRFEGEAAVDYMRAEIASFRDRVAEAVGPIDDEAIAKSIKLYNRNRELLSELYAMSRHDPSILPSDKALWLVASSALMEKSEHNELLEKALEELRSESRGGDTVRLFGIGSCMDQYDFVAAVEQAGGTFVDDDFCTGRRYFDTLVSEDGDPVEAIVKRLTDRAMCPCKNRPSDGRAEDIVNRAKAADAAGAVFFQFKFCEPHAFDYPHIKKALDAAGIPSLLLEIEQGSVSIEQLRTRVEALIETIRG
jgi:bzd-type benzoyl-CoA reductase N subunit